MMVTGAAFYFFSDEGDLILVACFLVFTVFSFVIAPISLHPCSIKPARFLFGTIVMIFFMLTFINVFEIYAFANLHDTTWGNRPSRKKRSSMRDLTQKNEFKSFRFRVLFWWLLANTVVAYTVVQFSRAGQHNFLLVLTEIIAGFHAVRFMFSLSDRMLHCC